MGSRQQSDEKLHWKYEHRVYMYTGSSLVNDTHTTQKQKVAFLIFQVAYYVKYNKMSKPVWDPFLFTLNRNYWSCYTIIWNWKKNMYPESLVVFRNTKWKILNTLSVFCDIWLVCNEGKWKSMLSEVNMWKWS